MMPQSVVRFLRVYASLVMLLVTGVMAIGTKPVTTADGANIETATTHAATENALRIVDVEGNGLDARLSFAPLETAVLRDALPTFRVGKSGVKTCAQSGPHVQS